MSERNGNGRSVQVEKRDNGVYQLVLEVSVKERKAWQKAELARWEAEIMQKCKEAAEPAISVENVVDLEVKPDGFHWVNDYVPGDGVTINNDPPVYCSHSECTRDSVDCCPANADTCFVYRSGKSRASRLQLPPARCFAKRPLVALPNARRCNLGKLAAKSGSNLENPPIYECNKKCKCTKESCENRVVQKGRKFPLCIFRTPDRGWGVKTKKRISKNEFVTEYVGEVCSERTVRDRCLFGSYGLVSSRLSRMR